jgi:hypothetical protein
MGPDEGLLAADCALPVQAALDHSGRAAEVQNKPQWLVPGGLGITGGITGGFGCGT